MWPVSMKPSQSRKNWFLLFDIFRLSTNGACEILFYLLTAKGLRSLPVSKMSFSRKTALKYREYSITEAQTTHTMNMAQIMYIVIWSNSLLSEVIHMYINSWTLLRYGNLKTDKPAQNWLLETLFRFHADRSHISNIVAEFLENVLKVIEIST